MRTPPSFCSTQKNFRWNASFNETWKKTRRNSLSNSADISIRKLSCPYVDDFLFGPYSYDFPSPASFPLQLHDLWFQSFPGLMLFCSFVFYYMRICASKLIHSSLYIPAPTLISIWCSGSCLEAIEIVWAVDNCSICSLDSQCTGMTIKVTQTTLGGC